MRNEGKWESGFNVEGSWVSVVWVLVVLLLIINFESVTSLDISAGNCMSKISNKYMNDATHCSPWSLSPF